MSGVEGTFFPNVFSHVTAKISAMAGRCFFGSQHTAVESTFPRMVVTPTADAYAPAAITGYNPNAVLQVAEGFTVDIWAATVDDARLLRSQFIASLLHVSGNACEVGSGLWVPMADVGRHGVTYTLLFTIGTPVVEATLQELAGLTLGDDGRMVFPKPGDVPYQDTIPNTAGVQAC